MSSKDEFPSFFPRSLTDSFGTIPTIFYPSWRGEDLLTPQFFLFFSSGFLRGGLSFPPGIVNYRVFPSSFNTCSFRPVSLIVQFVNPCAAEIDMLLPMTFPAGFVRLFPLS